MSSYAIKLSENFVKDIFDVMLFSFCVGNCLKAIAQDSNVFKVVFLSSLLHQISLRLIRFRSLIRQFVQ